MALEPMIGVQARRENTARRASMLVELERLSAAGRGVECLPLLIRACQEDEALLKLRVWTVDHAIWQTGRTVACRRIMRAVSWCGTQVNSASKVTVGWLLDERTSGARLSAWLLAVALDLGYRLPGPDPYQVQLAANWAAAVPNRQINSHSS